MKIRWVLAVVTMAAIIVLWFLLTPKSVSMTVEPEHTPQVPQLNTLIQEFLTNKKSPLAPDTDFLLEHKHWKLLIAISAIESQYCKRQLGYNCWGIGGDSAYRHYTSYQEAIVDADKLIEKWQAKGKWLTVESMNGSYVVPKSQNWVQVVNKNIKELDGIISRTTRTSP